MRKCLFIILLSFSFLYSEAPPIHPSLLSIGGGVYNVLRTKGKEGVLQLQYTGQPFWGKNAFLIRPLVSLFGTFHGGFYLCGGVAFDLNLGPYIAITPSFASGFYYKGQSKDLGYSLENRSSIEFCAKFPNQSRLGLQFYHISNGSMSRRNPGVEALLLHYSFPIN